MTSETAATEAGRADAIERMREALALLDRTGLTLAACHLQMAIDVAAGTTLAAANGDHGPERLPGG